MSATLSSDVPGDGTIAHRQSSSMRAWLVNVHALGMVFRAFRHFAVCLVGAGGIAKTTIITIGILFTLF